MALTEGNILCSAVTRLKLCKFLVGTLVLPRSIEQGLQPFRPLFVVGTLVLAESMWGMYPILDFRLAILDR